jgi:hypothetical protein
MLVGDTSMNLFNPTLSEILTNPGIYTSEFYEFLLAIELIKKSWNV